MEKEKRLQRGRAYQTVVNAVGVALWLFAATRIGFELALREQLTLLAFVALVVFVSFFPLVFPMPSGQKFTDEKMTFNLSDAFILLAAYRYGIIPAILIGGLEGFISSRRAVRRLSSNLFSLGMLALAAAAAATTLHLILHFGFGGESGKLSHPSFAVALAMPIAGLVHIFTNMGLLSALLALRQGNGIVQTWKTNFLWTVPMFLPSGTAATLIHFAFKYNSWSVAVIGAPVLLSIYFGHRQYRKGVRERLTLMEKAQQERIRVMEKAHRETIEALAVTINAKDEVTHEHVLRVQIYALGVARLLGCSEAEIEALRAGALLHDIGKIAVPDHILNKPGKLTAAEFEQMKMHTLAGAQILSRVEFPYPIVPIVRSHHERWDGGGYPDDLKGEEIPLTARILSVVDCFDAVREDRPYRKGMTREAALEFIMSNSGKMFDPRVVGTFITHLPEFEAEIQAMSNMPAPTFGIQPVEQLSEAARRVAPAAGLADESGSRLETDVEKQLSPRELKSLYHFARTLNRARGRDEIIAILSQQLHTLAPHDLSAVILASPESNLFTVIHASGDHRDALKDRQIAPSQGVIGWVIANRQPCCNADPKLDLPPALAQDGSYRTLAVFPLIKDEAVFGAIALYSQSLAEYNLSHQRILLETAQLVSESLSAVTEVAANAARPSTRIESTSLQIATGLANSSMGGAEIKIESELTH